MWALDSVDEWVLNFWRKLFASEILISNFFLRPKPTHHRAACRLVCLIIIIILRQVAGALIVATQQKGAVANC